MREWRDVMKAISTYTACFVWKVCGSLWSTWGAPLGEGKSGVKAGIANAKVACRANTLGKGDDME